MYSLLHFDCIGAGVGVEVAENRLKIKAGNRKKRQSNKKGCGGIAIRAYKYKHEATRHAQNISAESNQAYFAGCRIERNLTRFSATTTTTTTAIAAFRNQRATGVRQHKCIIRMVA